MQAAPTCEGVNDEAEDHGDHGDKDPVRQTLVLHAAVDGDRGLVALQHKHRTAVKRMRDAQDNVGFT